MTTITVLWILLTRTEQHVSFALKCWFLGAAISVQCFKEQIGDLLWNGKFTWQGVFELEVFSLVPFGIAYVGLLACRAMGGGNPQMTQEEFEAHEREEAEYRAQLQEMANWKAINYFDTHRKD